MTAITVPRGRSKTDHILRTAARGATLVGIAIVVGIILLRVVDQGSPSPGSGTGTVPVVTSTTIAGQTPLTTAKTGTTATTKAGSTATTKAGSERAASTIKVWVYNASGVSGQAGTVMNKLLGLGYLRAGTGNAAANQTGNTVQCKSGFDKEAATLAKKVGGNATVSSYPSPAPSEPTSAGADCIVTIGK